MPKSQRLDPLTSWTLITAQRKHRRALISEDIISYLQTEFQLSLKGLYIYIYINKENSAISFDIKGFTKFKVGGVQAAGLFICRWTERKRMRQ